MAPKDTQTPQQQGREEVPYYARKRRRWVLWAVWLLLLVPFVYIGLQVFSIMVPNVRTQLAIMEQMTDAVSVEGIATFGSTEIEQAAAGAIYYTVAEGERVHAGGEVATQFSSEGAIQAQLALEQAQAELAQLEAAQKTLVEGGDVETLLTQRQTGVYNLLDVVQSGNYSGISSARTEITTAANKLQVATGETVDFGAHAAVLQAQVESLQQQAVPAGSIAAPHTGFFTPSDKYDRRIVPYETAQQATPLQLQELLAKAPEYYPDTVVGHIVADYNWQFFTLVDAKQAERFSEGQKLQLSFPEVSEEAMPVQVAALTPDEETGLVKVELQCDNIGATVLRLRQEKAQIIFSTERGIRVDKQALRIIDGVEGVYVLNPGNVVSFRRISIELEDENYMLIPGTVKKDVNEVMLYDKIIIDSGGVELVDGKIL